MSGVLSKTINISVETPMFCYQCQAELRGRLLHDPHNRRYTLEVEPCQNCIDSAIEQSFRENWNDDTVVEERRPSALG